MRQPVPPARLSRRAALTAAALCFALLVLASLAPRPAAAFEVEDHARFGPPEAAATLRVVSTTDVELFAPLIERFLAARPGVAVDYTVAASTELNAAIIRDALAFDVAISSATDLQTKLANDGFARAHSSALTETLPPWARWRDHLFAFTEEPAAIVFNRAALAGAPPPRTRQDLIALLRENPGRFVGRVGTYDIRESGLGYLFATQDARTSETYWRLAEVMGRLGARLYCCSSQMIEDVASGRLAVAYNVLGSYALAQDNPDLVVVLPEDFTTVMLRTAFISHKAENPELGGAFIDHLLAQEWSGGWVSPAARPPAASGIGPGLLVYLDRFKRADFTREWGAAMLQTPP